MSNTLLNAEKAPWGISTNVERVRQTSRKLQLQSHSIRACHLTVPFLHHCTVILNWIQNLFFRFRNEFGMTDIRLFHGKFSFLKIEVQIPPLPDTQDKLCKSLRAGCGVISQPLFTTTRP